ncbi:MAG: Flp pilus assembly protein CpaB [Candidatus Eremiobacteraeota bacterium]|nr:Flp pilus assembly protein CpaB [Candidatus Eremiobacteraeota bacterium]
MNTRRTTIIVAVLLAIGTGWLTLTFLRSVQRTNAPASQLRRVLVATVDIPARAPIGPTMFAVQTRPMAEVDPDAIGDPARIAGSISLISIPSGSILTQSKVGHPEDVGLSVRLKPGLRAVSISVDRVKGVAGLLQAGDRVDVIASVPKEPGKGPRAVTIIRGATVLAVGSTLESAQATPSPDEQNAATVTLGVTPKQADLLTVADNNTNLRLALRSPRESLRSEAVEALNLNGLADPSMGTPHFALPAPLPAAAPALAVAPAAASAARQPVVAARRADPPGVEVIGISGVEQ